ncbi:uncharacterized protein LOC129314628 [Prosopis cineraria]|uniref:uncharacterized protein LOC129314628 n=1 Tax=Prosopis cineraria TaxID=364024 RepID=UPI00240FE399|nr:uncharacterized protein LOC129314628 [Prosopis cineraria]
MPIFKSVRLHETEKDEDPFRSAAEPEMDIKASAFIAAYRKRVTEETQARAVKDKEEGEAEEERRARTEKDRRAKEEREAEEERRARADKDKRAKEEREAEEERQARANREEYKVVLTNEDEDILYMAICANNWNSAKAFLDENPSALTAKITPSGKTALHVAVLFGHVTIVEELLKLVPPKFLETADDFGNTPLVIATITGITQVAEFLVNKNDSILGIANSTDELPLTLAFLNGHQQMGRYLYSVTPFKFLHPQNSTLQGPMLLHCCLQTQCFDIALHLLKKCQELLFVSDKEGWKPIYGIATMNSALTSPSDLVFWKQLVFHYIDINSTPSSNRDRLPTRQQDTSGSAHVGNLTRPGHRLLQQLISFTYYLIGIKKLQELKSLHAQADEILRLVCKNASKRDQVSVFADALFLAAKEGNVKFVVQISQANPDLLLIGDSSYQNMFCYAVKHRQAGVFSLIHGLRFKDVIVSSKDKNGNTLLHLAAAQAPVHVLKRIYGPTLQMQRELQWFKEVEGLIPPTIRGARNKDGMSAEELFRKSHKYLMKHGEEWIKATSSSCSVVGGLIVTIMFAVAFTVPGGNDQTFGYPLFIKQQFFKVFLFSTILSLLSSSTSVLMFLAILTSHYSEEKFLKSIPTKLMLGLSSLFISILSMMIAFLSTIRLMLKHTNYSWGLLPIIILASVPVFLFVLSQFPLLLHTAFCTYGNIFNKKVGMWP